MNECALVFAENIQFQAQRFTKEDVLVEASKLSTKSSTAWWQECCRSTEGLTARWLARPCST